MKKISYLILIIFFVSCSNNTFHKQNGRGLAQVRDENPELIDWAKISLDKDEIVFNFNIFRSEFETGIIDDLLKTWRSRFEYGAGEDSFLFPEEGAAIDYYKKELGYSEINSFLRGTSNYSRSVTAILAGAKLITSGLNRMKGVRQYYNKTVYRGAYLPESIIANYIQGQVATERAFTSTSIKRKVAELFAAKRPREGYRRVLFIIQSLTGKLISTERAAEAEILFIPFTRFNVTSSEENNDWTIIQMAEIL